MITRAPQEFRDMISRMIMNRLRYIPAVNGVPTCLPGVGFDCWGFVRYLFFLDGVNLPSSPTRAGKHFVGIDMPVYKDIMIIWHPDIFTSVHVVYFESRTMVVHCADSHGGVVRSKAENFVGKRKCYRLRCV